MAGQGVAMHGWARLGVAWHGIYTNEVSMEKNTTLYPEYKEAGKLIANGGKDAYSDGELAAMLMVGLDTKEFQFAILKLKDHLLNTYGIDFIRVDIGGEKGRKIASSTETVRITVSRLAKRVKRAAVRQRTVIETVDRSELDSNDEKTYDMSMVRNGLLLSFLAKTSRKSLSKQSTVRIDVPKVIITE